MINCIFSVSIKTLYTWYIHLTAWWIFSFSFKTKIIAIIHTSVWQLVHQQNGHQFVFLPELHDCQASMDMYTGGDQNSWRMARDHLTRPWLVN